MIVYPKKQIQIEVETQIGALLFDKAITINLKDYFNYKNIFLIENIGKSFKYIGNNYITQLKKDKQPSFKSIYSLGLIKLEMLKTYKKINLINNFIQSFKFFANVSIFFKIKAKL